MTDDDQAHVDFLVRMAKVSQEREVKTGGSAYPVPEKARPGMTLRDYFAGQVLSGWAADPETRWGDLQGNVEFFYRVADAMIKERDK